MRSERTGERLSAGSSPRQRVQRVRPES
jgi:hypothetical protein